MNKNVRQIALYLLIIAALAFFVATFGGGGTKPSQLNYTQLSDALSQGRVTEMTVHAKDRTISGKFVTRDAKHERKTYDFTSAYFSDDAFAALVQKAQGEPNNLKVQVDPQETPWWAGLLASLLPIGLLVLLMFWFMQQMQGGNSRIMSFGKAKAKRMTRDQPRITFKDVAGVDEAVDELREIVEFLKTPEKFRRLAGGVGGPQRVGTGGHDVAGHGPLEELSRRGEIGPGRPGAPRADDGAAPHHAGRSRGHARDGAAHPGAGSHLGRALSPHRLFASGLCRGGDRSTDLGGRCSSSPLAAALRIRS